MSQTTPPPGDGPSEEEVRAYLSQMRGAPADQVIAEVLQGLLNAAQVKLGRNDARLLLDAAAAVIEQARPYVDRQLTNQVDEALTQLRMAQVEAEREVASRGEAEPNDLPDRPAPGGGAAAPSQAGGPTSPGGSTSPPPQGGPAGGDSPLNKLWIPGR